MDIPEHPPVVGHVKEPLVVSAVSDVLAGGRERGEWTGTKASIYIKSAVPLIAV